MSDMLTNILILASILVILASFLLDDWLYGHARFRCLFCGKLVHPLGTDHYTYGSSTYWGDGPFHIDCYMAHEWPVREA